MVIEKLRRLWQPELFQGNKRYKNYFEGWYFKLVDVSEEYVCAVIPGISLGRSKETSHAFIQCVNGKTGDSRYLSFPIDDFTPSTEKFEISIANNYFSTDSIRLDLNDSDHTIQGTLLFEQVVPYPKNLLSPGFMGWGTFIPFMQCKHGIVSMNHLLKGKLEIDGTPVSFDGGKGYTEKDWGHSFPSSYIWMQSNHFTNEGMSFTLSLARISWLHTTFTGFGSALWYNGHIYTFATYTGARITSFEKGANELRMTIQDTHHELAIEALQGSVVALKSPDKGTMTKTIFESLTSTINLKFFELSKQGRRLLCEDRGRNAGLEIMDHNDELLRDLNR
jgi:tocopherol cyclase